MSRKSPSNVAWCLSGTTPHVTVDYRGFRDVRLGSMVQDFPDLNFRRFQLR